MNPYGILGILLGFAALGSWATYEDGQASKWKGNYDSLKASYQTAADKARSDAAAQEAKDTAALKAQSVSAIQQATNAKNNAENQLKTYQAKLVAASKAEDLPHKCAGVSIAPDLIPAP